MMNNIVGIFFVKKLTAYYIHARRPPRRCITYNIVMYFILNGIFILLETRWKDCFWQFDIRIPNIMLMRYIIFIKKEKNEFIFYTELDVTRRYYNLCR